MSLLITVLFGILFAGKSFNYFSKLISYKNYTARFKINATQTKAITKITETLGKVLLCLGPPRNF